jgi:hypothetical protein
MCLVPFFPESASKQIFVSEIYSKFCMSCSELSLFQNRGPKFDVFYLSTTQISTSRPNGTKPLLQRSVQKPKVRGQMFLLFLFLESVSKQLHVSKMFIKDVTCSDPGSFVSSVRGEVLYTSRSLNRLHATMSLLFFSSLQVPANSFMAQKYFQSNSCPAPALFELKSPLGRSYVSKIHSRFYTFCSWVFSDSNIFK